MRKIIYDVAISLDGFIAGPGGSIEGFVAEGEHVQDYYKRLATYSTVIMGRSTYEFGYKYGLKPGERPYPHMEHYVFSSTIGLDSSDGVTIIRQNFAGKVRDIKAEIGGDIYLCGGGRFAGLLLDHNLIDRLILKLNPLLLGDGVRLFESTYKSRRLEKISEKAYDSGVSLLIFDFPSI